MRNETNRPWRRVKSESLAGDENTAETSNVQGKATLTNVFENADFVFDRNLDSELTEPSEVSNEIEVTLQRFTKQNNTKSSLVEGQLNNKFLRVTWRNQNKNHNITNSEKKTKRTKVLLAQETTFQETIASNIEIYEDKTQDVRFPSKDID